MAKRRSRVVAEADTNKLKRVLKAEGSGSKPRAKKKDAGMKRKSLFTHKLLWNTKAPHLPPCLLQRMCVLSLKTKFS